MRKKVEKIAKKILGSLLAGTAVVGMVAIFISPWLARVIAYDIFSDEWAMVSFVVAGVPFFVTVPVFWSFSFLKLFWLFGVEHADELNGTNTAERSRKWFYRWLYRLLRVAPIAGCILAGIVPAPFSNALLVIIVVQVARGKMSRWRAIRLIVCGSMIRITADAVGANILGPEFFQQGFWSRVDFLFSNLFSFLSRR